MASTLTAFDAVRWRIAAAVLSRPETLQVGHFTLRERQRLSVRAIQDALDRHGGALVADAVGSGKTVLALAVAAEYEDVLVFAPAAVREQWRRAAERAQVAVRIHSHEALSRGETPRGAPLIVVDEAHHFRSASSQRYRRLAELARGRHLLLLSATPVVNRRSDRDALLTLFLGSREPGPSLIDQVVLRRTDARPNGIRVRRLSPLEGAPDVPGLTDALDALPPPLPLADGASAAALVRFSLAMAWSSSLAALDAALRRRIQRGTAIADMLASGRWPSRDALRDWVLDGETTQLAFTFAGTDDVQPPPGAAQALRRHLDAVRAMRRLIADAIQRDTQARAAAVRMLIDSESPRRAVLLAGHAETVRVLFNALRSEPGVVAIVGARVHAAAGRWSRDEVLRALGPRNAPWRPDDLRGIRLLLATDILAEGVELQGCATVIHGDFPWTPARLEQRLGRVAREGQRDEVHELSFRLPNGAERLLALRHRLTRKRRARRSALAGADAVAALQAELASWLGGARHLDDDAPRVAAASADRDGFIAVLSDDESRCELLAGIHLDGHWRVTSQATDLLGLLRSVGEPTRLQRHEIVTAHRALTQWMRRQRVRRVLRDEPRLPDLLLRRAARRIDAWLASRPLAERSAAVVRATELRRALAAVRGAAFESGVERALGASQDPEHLTALEQLLAGATTQARASATRLTALLVLRRSQRAPSPPSASPDTAATR